MKWLNWLIKLIGVAVLAQIISKKSMKLCLIKMAGNDSYYREQKIKFWNATKCNIKTQTWTMSVDIKHNWYLQLMYHHGRACPNHNHVWWWRRFRSPDLLLWTHYWPEMIKFRWHPTISGILFIIFYSMDICSR